MEKNTAGFTKKNTRLLNGKSYLIISIIVIALMVTGFFMLTGEMGNFQNTDTEVTVEPKYRGLVAIETPEGIYLSWKFLGTDPQDIGFYIYRDGVRINSEVITDRTNFTDEEGTAASEYYVRASVDGVEGIKSETVEVLNEACIDIRLNKPEGGSIQGSEYEYYPNDAEPADLDGDGEVEIVLKWLPSNAKDNSERGYTGPTLLDAYKLDGTFLWRINLGTNIRSGDHYTPFLVYDFDSDGRAELICRTSDGSIDGEGEVIGKGNTDYRNEEGLILTGNEYLSLFDGETGTVLDTVHYKPKRGNVKNWGDDYGNRSDRFLAAVAYLDGDSPSAVMCRGYYTRSVLAAYTVENKKLKKQWVFDSNMPGNGDYEGQGFHNLAVADCDLDGCDEIVYGACVIDHNGRGLYSLGLGHGDALHVGDFEPSNQGLEAWGCFETGDYGAVLWDLDTGSILMTKAASEDTGRCVAGNFVSGNDGGEMSYRTDPKIYSTRGDSLGKWEALVGGELNFVCYWDGDLEQEALDDIYVYKNGNIIFCGQNVMSCNGTKHTPSLCADILGDWREEIIWPSTDGEHLKIYMTTQATSYRIYALMDNRQYRCQVAAQNVGYNQPAHTDYFLGTGYALPVFEE